jgi:hypothetical protein
LLFVGISGGTTTACYVILPIWWVLYSTVYYLVIGIRRLRKSAIIIVSIIKLLEELLTLVNSSSCLRSHAPPMFTMKEWGCTKTLILLWCYVCRYII